MCLMTHITKGANTPVPAALLRVAVCRHNVPGAPAVDASALLLNHEHEGRNRLHRLDVESGELHALDHPDGTISGAGVRPDGEVWFRLASGAEPATIRTAGMSLVARLMISPVGCVA